MSEAYIPSDLEERLAEDAYLRYVTGVATLRDIDNEVNMAMNANVIEDRELEVIVIRAEVMMFEGLRQVIRLGHPASIRSKLAKIEHRFADALPHMINTVDRVKDARTEELIRLDAGFDYIAPRPMINGTLYKHICHPHYDKLFATSLVDGLMPAPVFDEILQGRNMTHLGSSVYISA